jgi:2'-5' RNA ligase
LFFDDGMWRSSSFKALPKPLDEAKPFGPGGRKPPAVLNRYFFAIGPAPPVALRIDALAHELRRSLGLRGQPIRPERYHISLCGVGWLGEAPTEIVARLRTIGAAVTGPIFAVAFDHAVSFGKLGGRRAVVLASSETLPALNLLQKRLRCAMAAANLRPPSQFNPHVTLLYDEKPVSETGIPLLRWTVREFVLIRSVHGERRHEHLARWPLGGGRPAGPA